MTKPRHPGAGRNSRLVVVACLMVLAVARPATGQPTPGAVVGLWPDLGGVPARLGGGERDAAVIVGVSDYAYLPDIPGAAENARDWYLWLTKGRDVPAERVALLQTAGMQARRVLLRGWARSCRW